MPDQGFYLTISGIAMSFAGFTGLLNAFRGGGAWDPMLLYQLRVIVAYAVATLFAALSVVPLAGLIGAHDTVVALGVALTLMHIVLGLWSMRGDMRLTREHAASTPVRAGFTLLGVLAVLAALAAALTGAPAVYQLALLLALANPAGTFVYVISRIDR
jgi:hypothetical protein